MKRITLFFTILLLSQKSFGQAGLPTSWSFATTTFPAGWSENGTATYSGATSAKTIPSCKLDGTGDYVMIFFADDPGPLNYYIKGATAGSPWAGTFDVQESVNGTTWTTLHNFNNNLDVNAYIKFTDTPKPDSRYIRFYFTTKASGSNVGLDDITLDPAPASPAAEINIVYKSDSIVNNNTIVFNTPVSTPLNLPLIIQNWGTQNSLTIDSVSITGINASEYSIIKKPVTIIAVKSDSLVIRFLPLATGTRLADVKIYHNDVNENPYTIRLYGAGGNYASEPSANPSALTFPVNKSYRIGLSFTPASPAPDGGYLVLIKKNSAVADVPQNGSTYKVGDYIGTSKVAYVGKNSSIFIRNVIASTTYYFSIFAFNGTNNLTSYRTSGPLTGSAISNKNEMGSYYSGITTTDADFITKLHTKVNSHTSIFYGNFTITNINHFSAQDTTGGKKYVMCPYTGDKYVYNDPFDWTISGYSREHSYPHSWMPTNPANNPELPEYNDQHNLFPVIFDEANAKRVAYPYGIVATVEYQYKDGKFGKDAGGKTVYEPRNQHKGDAARALFYMCIAYNTVGGKNWFIPTQQDQNLLKAWHLQDPPDAWEMSRNDFLDSLQKNRNPFVDSAQFVKYINFYNMTKITNPSAPEINVFDKSVSFINNDTVSFNTSINTPFNLRLLIQNSGIQTTLIIDSVAFTGTNSTEYSVIKKPASILALNSDSLVIRFSPVNSGTGLVNLKIYNNDADENPFTIHLKSIIPAGISESETLPLLTLFPNPVSGSVVNLLIKDNHSKNSSIYISDITGKNIFMNESISVSSSSQIVPIDIRSLPNGFYFVKAIIDEKIIYHKLIKL